MITQLKRLTGRLGILLVCISGNAMADDAGTLKTRLSSLESFQAGFSQQVIDEQGETVHQASGTIMMARPNQLRWETQQPDETVLIADGESVWHIDYWVEQVTVMSQQQAVENNPMVLLTSNDEKVWQQYSIEQLDDKTFKVSALADSGQIKALTLAFADGGLASLVMLDSQGQQSVIEFSQRQFNQTISSDTFRANVPEGFMVDDQRS
ncbi:outer membrane lipoprotein chaperone LolA [Alteromonas gilva]|uniref:Outer-membrane lipoprotein carrier protein n=1 Tax=Alteromonas gilva TaxID=2987522 RepID=A0ABT5L272_9ALTE|nr:outer membrane lipoprotein chaperone LolA [Alteromonas gilva]MDC8831140.1 outer membrane lipoprotein chaperone LolA [Alteromonas gilva]